MELVACHLSKIGYLGTLLKPLPSYAPVKQRRWERAWRGFLCQWERFSKEIKILFKGFLFFRVYSLLDTAVTVDVFFPSKHFFLLSTLYFMLCYCDHHIWISVINHPRHMGTVSKAGGFKVLFCVCSKPTDLSDVVRKQNEGLYPTETLIN